jgi:5-methylcytosine-specific restriction endonuclease McrA
MRALRQRWQRPTSDNPLAALDHIVPVRCGGELVIENTQVLHKDVNRAKGSLTNDQFIQLCREVVEHASANDFQGGK